MATLNNLVGLVSGASLPFPQGRLTLTSATPVLVATVSAAGTIFYTPYLGTSIPIYNGTTFTPTVFSELSNVLANSAVGNAGPAAVANNSNYDLFVWNNAGTLTLTRGPLWTSDTARGTGAGTTQLTLQNGIYVNTVAITNGPGALLGTYVGTFRSNGTATTDMIFGGTGAGGTAAVIGVWNMYNRVQVATRTTDNTATYTFNSSTVRAIDGSATMRCSFVRGINEDSVEANYEQKATSAAVTNTTYLMGIGLDSTTSLSADGGAPIFSTNAAAALVVSPYVAYQGYPGLGFHFLTPLEQGDNTNNWTLDPRSQGFQTLMRA